MNIILTGGSTGIGVEILKKISKNKKDNILVLSRSMGEINLPNVKWISVDLSKEKELNKIRQEIINFKCDILINNAGSGKVSDLEDLDFESMNSECILNLIAPITLTSLVASNMKKNNFGRIINISSISGVRGTPYLFTYSATKAGLINFTQSSAEYFKGYNITVNAICPGGINTKMSIDGRKEISTLLNLESTQYQKNMLLKMGKSNLIQSSEVADLVEFLINSSAINGQYINICGLMEK